MQTRAQDHIGMQVPVVGAFLTMLFLLGAAGMLAQTPANCTFVQGSGQTSTSVQFNPLQTPKNPVFTFITPGTQPWLPTIPIEQYQAIKAASAQNVRTSFLAPPSVQSSAPTPRAPAAGGPISVTPTSSWQGIADTNINPPNPSMAVGPFDVVAVVNSSIGWFGRDGTLQNLTTFPQWFAGLLPTVCPSGLGQCLFSDPTIRYDQLHGHFLFLDTIRDFNAQRSYLLLSVSNGATFDSGWKIWALDARLDGPNQTANFGDFWRFGFDNAAIYLGGDMFSQSQTYQYSKVRILKKSEVYNPATTTLNYQDFWNLHNADGTFATSPMPVQQRGKPAGANSSMFINAGIQNLPANYLTVWKFADPLASPATLSCYTVGGLWPYSLPGVAPQLGGPGVIDTNDTSVLQAIYRNGFIYAARNAGYTDQPTTVTFDVIDTSSMKLNSQSRLVNTNSFYPAFDVPATVPSGVPFATANVITGTTTAPDGSLTYAGISNLKAGEAYYNDGSGSSRWGDYSWGSVDPIYGGLWVYGEYAKPPAAGGFGVWGTWAGYFPWSTNPTFSDVPSSSPFFDYINVMSSWQITLGCSTSLFCPSDLVTRGQFAAFLVRAVAGDNFTYTQTPYFTDVPATSPFFSYVQKLRDLGITQGCAPGLFCPDGNVSRADAAAFIVRGKMAALTGENFPYPTTPYFTDVPATSPSFSYVQKLRELGITLGCAPAQYCPASLLSRDQASTFIVRAFLN